jgi:hypothetical protein
VVKNSHIILTTFAHSLHHRASSANTYIMRVKPRR